MTCANNLVKVPSQLVCWITYCLKFVKTVSSVLGKEVKQHRKGYHEKQVFTDLDPGLLASLPSGLCSPMELESDVRIDLILLLTMFS